MHYFATVLIEECPHDEDGIQAAVEKVMLPYKERWEPSPGCDPDDDEDDGVHSGHWDWWQIGGRYTGRWSEYDPMGDPANWEPCMICHGTGMRMDMAGITHRAQNPEYTCNGCGYYATPAGIAVKWATSWIRHEFDVIPVKKLLVLPVDPSFSLVAPDGFHERESWDGRTFIPMNHWPQFYLSKLREFQDMTAVIVDYHN